MGQQGKLPRLREAAIQALLQHSTLKAAADSIGISERTLRRWLEDQEFAKAYAGAKSAALASALSKLAGGSGEAVDALLRVIRSRRGSSAARVSAAVRLLELAMRDREDMDFDARLRALELELDRREKS